MHIFIDESGTFVPNVDVPSPSVVAALIIPESKLEEISDRYLKKLRPRLADKNGIVKGRELSSMQIASVVNLLVKNEVLLEISAIEMGMHKYDALVAHRDRQAEAITATLTPEFHPNSVKSIWELRRELENMAPQLYVQSAITFQLVRRIIEIGPMYFSQRRPKELGAFHWIVDAKDKFPTKWETWWKQVIRPMVQTMTLSEPSGEIVEGDYSYMERFRMETAEYLIPHFSQPSDLGPRPLNLNLLITESFRFSPYDEVGLELVDIVANAVRRALRGNLEKEGWYELPRLMIHLRDRHYIQIIALNTDPTPELPYRSILQHFRKRGKSMIAPRFASEYFG